MGTTILLASLEDIGEGDNDDLFAEGEEDWLL
jgi:hypothetical protein